MDRAPRPRWRIRSRWRSVAALVVTVALVAGVFLVLDRPSSRPSPQPPSHLAAAAVTGGSDGATLEIDVPATSRTTLRLQVDQGQLTGIPSSCESSTVVRRASYLTEDGAGLSCVLRAAAQERTVDVGIRSTTAVVSASGEVAGQPLHFSDIHVVPAPSAPELRLLSSPDFLNADLANLRHGPGRWTPARSANGINASYRKAVAHVMDDWRSHDPDAVLVAGDLVDGRWGRDDHHTGTFGPVSTPAERRAAVRLAARTYYPAWKQRFRARGLHVFPAMGDHEYGDNPWPAAKRALAPTFEQQFARAFTQRADGSPRFADHPPGRHALTAYAWRPRPDVQVVTLDDFDITPGHARERLDRQQLRWLHGVLARARADGVTWTVVQGHVPILEPVRHRGSSDLRYQGGEHSALWRLLKRYHVDLYLCGEVHDTTAIDRDGVLQLSHGGAFQYGLTTYALLDFYADHLQVTLNDFSSRVHGHGHAHRLWETARAGIPGQIRIRKQAFTIGTLTLGADRVVSDRTGILLPYAGPG